MREERTLDKGQVDSVNHPTGSLAKDPFFSQGLSQQPLQAGGAQEEAVGGPGSVKRRKNQHQGGLAA